MPCFIMKVPHRRPDASYEDATHQAHLSMSWLPYSASASYTVFLAGGHKYYSLNGKLKEDTAICESATVMHPVLGIKIEKTQPEPH